MPDMSEENKRWLSRFDYLPDAFVVEGPKAGGHLGFKPEQIDDPEFSLEKTVPQVIETVREFEEKAQRPIPVIAAGGIYDGADIDQFLRMGAAGVQMGTRFVATHECDADPRFKETYVQAKEEDIQIIKSPVGLPGRVVIGAFLEDFRRKRFILIHINQKTLKKKSSTSWKNYFKKIISPIISK